MSSFRDRTFRTGRHTGMAGLLPPPPPPDRRGGERDVFFLLLAAFFLLLLILNRKKRENEMVRIICYVVYESRRRCSPFFSFISFFLFSCASLNWVSIIMLENILCSKLSKRAHCLDHPDDVRCGAMLAAQFDHLNLHPTTVLRPPLYTPKIYFWHILWGLFNNCTFLTRLREKALKKHNLSRYKFQEFASFFYRVCEAHTRDSCKHHGFDGKYVIRCVFVFRSMIQWFLFVTGLHHPRAILPFRASPSAACW